MTNLFLGRKAELNILEAQCRQKRASFLVITGRRRIGKSRLIEEFSKPYELIKFTGLAPNPEVNAQAQRDEFARRLAKIFDLPPLKADDWADLFDTLGEQIQKQIQDQNKKSKKIIILLDEISWMEALDPTFLPKLKNCWDDGLKKFPEIMLILCGSVSSWIEENILSSTGFLGRVHQVIHLEELSLSECKGFFEQGGSKISPMERFQILAVTGGIPLYLENIDPSLNAVQNIQQLCFTPGGLLVREFEQIFTDLFSKRNALYKQIVQALAAGPLEPQALSKNLGYEHSGQMTQYFQELAKAGFLTRDYTWSIKTGTLSKLSRYRLSDNYVRFYLKYIEPKLTQINQKMAQFSDPSSWHQWPVILGLQFENLVLNNRHLIFEKLGIPASEIEVASPYFQNQTSKQKGCQIDLLIQTKHQSLLACEIKFSKNLLDSAVIEEMSKKLQNFTLPRGFSLRPVLIHVGGVTESLESAGYFSRILDFSAEI